MGNPYEPELGQAVFGNPQEEYAVPDHAEALIRAVLDEVGRVFWNRTLRAWDSCYCCEDPGIPGLVVRGYWWGECTCGFAEEEASWEESHPHGQDCYQTAYARLWEGLGSAVPEETARQLCQRHGIPWAGGLGSATHCTCVAQAEWQAWARMHDHRADCKSVLPNLECGALRLRWYKYFGRGMSCNVGWDADEWVEWFGTAIALVRGADVTLGEMEAP